MNTSLIELSWQGRATAIEYQWIKPQHGHHTPLVLLHEGLGSVAMWKDFPQRLAARLNWPVLVYSRPGYGRSSPRPPGWVPEPEFMHHQAHELLPALLRTLGVEGQVALLGHSDGGSIALLYASAYPANTAAIAVMAPHIFVEDLTLSAIAQARQAYLEGDLRQRLQRYHSDVDSAFWLWNDTWLAPAFAHWNIEEHLTQLRCPVLAIQGLDDPYGSLEQIRGIARVWPETQLQQWPQCGHSPHRDQPEATLAAISTFFTSHPS